MGIIEMLEAERFRVQDEAGLVLVADEALEKATDDLTKGRTHQSTQRPLNRNILIDGYKEGKEIKLKKAVDHEQDDSQKILALE